MLPNPIYDVTLKIYIFGGGMRSGPSGEQCSPHGGKNDCVTPSETLPSCGESFDSKNVHAPLHRDLALKDKTPLNKFGVEKSQNQLPLRCRDTQCPPLKDGEIIHGLVDPPLRRTM